MKFKPVKIAVIATAAALLTGCMQLETHTVIHSDGNVDSALVIGIQRSMAAMMGEEITAEDLCSEFDITDMLAEFDVREEIASMTEEEIILAELESGLSREMFPAIIDFVESMTVADVSDNEYVACRVTFTLHVDIMNALAEPVLGEIPGQEATITLENDIWTWSSPGLDFEDPAAGITSAMISRFAMSVTFPGEVLTNTSGTVSADGRTVSWDNASEVSGHNVITARNGGDSSSFSITGVLVGGVLALVVLVGAFLGVKALGQRNSSREDTAEEYEEYYDAEEHEYTEEYVDEEYYLEEEEEDDKNYEYSSEYGYDDYEFEE